MKTATRVGAIGLLAAALVSFDVAAPAESTPPADSTTSCPAAPLAEARAIVKEAWDREGWRQRNPVKKSQSRALGELRGCLDPTGKTKLSAYSGKLKVSFQRHRSYRLVAPYRGPPGQGYWLRWTAIPGDVVLREAHCERTFSQHTCWNTDNPTSSACGPYQFIGWTSCDTSSWRDKLRHHRTAAYVLRVQGPGAWSAW